MASTEDAYDVNASISRRLHLFSNSHLISAELRDLSTTGQLRQGNTGLSESRYGVAASILIQDSRGRLWRSRRGRLKVKDTRGTISY